VKLPYIFDVILHHVAVYSLLLLIVLSAILISFPGASPTMTVCGTVGLFLAIAIVIILPKPVKPITRAPRDMGSGIYMMQQFNPKDLVKGDYCWDADWGELWWDGKEWKTNR
jgi:hypothetical protein